MGARKVAIIGLGETGQALLAAVTAHAQLELVAVADTETERLRRFAAESSVRVFEDYRSLIVQTAHAGLDAIIATIDPARSFEFVQLAAERGLHVMHTPPPARTVDEARRLAGIFESRKATMFVPNTWPVLETLAPLEDLGEIRAIDVVISSTDTPNGWRGDAARAGGGVLLHGAYEAIEWLVQQLGMPNTVHASSSMAITTGTPRRYDTEDIAMLSLNCGDERLGHLTAFRGAPQCAWHATLVGTNASAALSADKFTIVPNAHSTPSVQVVPPDTSLSRTLDLLAAVIRGDGTSARPQTSYIGVLAVIEAAYLSARTNQPESPARYL